MQLLAPSANDSSYILRSPSNIIRPRRREYRSLAHLSHLFIGEQVLTPEVEHTEQKHLGFSTTGLDLLRVQSIQNI